jgi:hypothetical protein
MPTSNAHKQMAASEANLTKLTDAKEAELKKQVIAAINEAAASEAVVCLFRDRVAAHKLKTLLILVSDYFRLFALTHLFRTFNTLICICY